jgi:hypothetical protein
MAIHLRPPNELNERSSYGWAWLTLCLALALHVTDEALTDFLSVYNPTVLAIRQRLPFLPVPTFTFWVWLAVLIAAVIVLGALSVFAFRGSKRMVVLGYIFGICMLVNGLQHIAFSVYMRARCDPGSV